MELCPYALSSACQMEALGVVLLECSTWLLSPVANAWAMTTAWLLSSRDPSLPPCCYKERTQALTLIEERRHALGRLGASV